MYRVGQKDVRQGVSDDDKTLPGALAQRRFGVHCVWRETAVCLRYVS